MIKYKCLSYNKNYSEILNEELKKKFKSTFAFSNNDIKKFMLLLRKGVCLYDYMNGRERFNEIALIENEKFYNNWNMEDIADVDYVHANRVYKDFEIKNLGEYHDFYLKSNVLLLADVLKNFRTMCLEIYELDQAKLAAWQAAKSMTKSMTGSFKKAQVKLDLMTDIAMLLMIEESIRGGICNSIHWYAKVNNKYMKGYGKNKESSYLNYCNVNNLFGWAMSQKLLI